MKSETNKIHSARYFILVVCSFVTVVSNYKTCHSKNIIYLVPIQWKHPRIKQMCRHVVHLAASLPLVVNTSAQFATICFID